jgi:hypothetical protein
MSFRSEDLMADFLPPRQGDEEDDKECTNNTRAGGGSGGTKTSEAELALLRAQLRQALDAQS